MTLTLNTTLFVTWGGLMLAAAYWMRFDAPIWGGF